MTRDEAVPLLRTLVVAPVTIATDRASFGSVFWDLPEPNRRTRDAIIAGTSTTRSPAATSCWETR